VWLCHQIVTPVVTKKDLAYYENWYKNA